LDPNYLDLDPQERINKILALFSVFLGVGSICGGIIPIAGVIIAGLGILTGYFGRKSAAHKLATAGIIISAFGLLLSSVYAFFIYISY
jgi:hypothetical protein